ncbi:MAG: hypothetical protein Q9218_007623 [Villophora microphyllina]
MWFPRRAAPSTVPSLLLLSLFLGQITAQNLPPLTNNVDDSSPTTTAAAANTKAATKATATANTNTANAKASKAAAKPTALAAVNTDAALPSALPTLAGVKAPTPSVPPTADAPYMQKSKLPEGTVFICVGAGLAFIGLVVLAWRGLVAWSLHRSVRKAAMAPSGRYTQLYDGKSRSNTPGTTLYSAGPGSALSHDRLTAASKPGSKTNTARSSLFFSPTAGAGMQTPGNRASGYLPAGYYAAGNAAAGGGVPMTQIGGGPGAHNNNRYSRARSAGPSPPGTPSLPPSRGAEVAYGRPSTAGLSTQPSTSTLGLSTAPQGRAPSAYLDDLFEGHSGAGTRGERR